MKVFITGVAGFLGSHLAEYFLKEGHEVVGIDNMIGGESENVPKGVRFALCDCNDLWRVRDLIQGADVVYHLAATAHEGLSVFSPHENSIHGVAASAAIFAAAIHARVKRIVFTSSMARYGTQETLPFTEDMTPKPQDPYGIGKVCSEDTLRCLADEHGIEWVISVPHNIVGPKQCVRDPFRNVAAIFINLMLQGRQPIIYGDGEQRRCFSFVADCVEPLAAMATSEGVTSQVVNIGPDDEFISINQLAETIARIMHFPLDARRADARPREVRLANCSNAKARRLLGYEPKTSLADGLKAMIDWQRARGPRPFLYHMGLEIENDRMPKTWKERLF